MQEERKRGRKSDTVEGHGMEVDIKFSWGKGLHRDY
jgi:hypothetical protein